MNPFVNQQINTDAFLRKEQESDGDESWQLPWSWGGLLFSLERRGLRSLA